MTPRSARPAALLTGLVLLAGCSSGGSTSDADAAATSAPADAPALDVEVVLDGLDHPWDVAQAPDGTLLVDQRGGGFTAVLPDGTAQEVTADLDDLWADGETGLMGLVLDPGFADDRRFYTCMGVADGGADGGPGIEVVAWTVDDGWTSATRVADPLVGGIPVNTDSGRHGGCRLRFDPQGQLLVGTGDNALGTNPQDLSTLAGKLLRVDPATGRPSADNPFLELTDPTSHAIVGYGHRNVQGIAVRPGTGPGSGTVYTAEQGSQVDDEVNLATDGGNYGWDPVGQGEYDESVPMTDPEIPGRSRPCGPPATPPSPSRASPSSTASSGAPTTACCCSACRRTPASSRCGWPTTDRWSSSSASPSSRAPTAGSAPRSWAATARCT